jgi:hypothetical protein
LLKALVILSLDLVLGPGIILPVVVLESMGIQFNNFLIVVEEGKAVLTLPEEKKALVVEVVEAMEVGVEMDRWWFERLISLYSLLIKNAARISIKKDSLGSYQVGWCEDLSITIDFDARAQHLFL